ncbi:MAG: DJ-1/PfpI family protein [Candidatus Micrarchaeota archaeon]
MTKILMVVAQDGFRDEEFAVPKEMLEKHGYTIVVASINRTKATGSKGMVLQPDMAVFEANPEYFKGIIIVGGPNSPMLAEKKEVRDLLNAANSAGKVVGGICLGVMALATAGVLANKKATVYPDRNAIVLLRQSGATYLAENVVVDGNIITADGPMSAGKFGTALIDALKK